jgi:hypothetical protein
MADKQFAARLCSELQRFYAQRQEMLETWETLTQERGIIRKRIVLLREFLTLEGINVDLPDTFSENLR